MSITAITCAVLVGLAVSVLVGGSATQQRLHAIVATFPRDLRSRAGGPADGLHPLSPVASSTGVAPRLASFVAGIAAWMLIGGTLGAVVGIVVALVGPVALSRLEPRSARLRRQRMYADAPVVADLMASCLASGSSVLAATDAVTQAIGDPIASVLGHAVAHMRLGADPGAVWASLTNEAALAPIARAVVRSNDSGAPLADILLRVADDLRARRRTELASAANTVGIRAVGPLGLCFLPAFLLLGVVPLVASLVEGVLP